MADYASAIGKIVELTNPPVVQAVGEDYVKEGYRRAVKPTAELVALLNEQDIESAKLKHEQSTLKAKLDFNAVKPFERITTLSSLREMLKAEVKRGAAAFPYFVNVVEYNTVMVCGSYEIDCSRKNLYTTVADNESFDFKSQPLEQAIITLQSRYVNSGDVGYIIELCSRVSKQAEVTSEDNGITQRVQATKGIAMKANETVRNRVKLSPFRTFMEVEQPESEYLLRLSEQRDEIYVSLIESDGGAWKLTAKANIAEYLKKNLSKLIEERKVIVLQ